jgi:hypothetical protein
VALTDDDRAALAAWLAAGKTERRIAFRAQVILAVAEGLRNAAVAGQLGTRPATVSKWRGRFDTLIIPCTSAARAARSCRPPAYTDPSPRRPAQSLTIAGRETIEKTDQVERFQNINRLCL